MKNTRERDKWAEAEDASEVFSRRPSWITFGECKATGFVNCTFGADGPCQNNKHSNT